MNNVVSANVVGSDDTVVSDGTVGSANVGSDDTVVSVDNEIQTYKLTITGDIKVDNKNRIITTQFDTMQIGDNAEPSNNFDYSFSKDGITFNGANGPEPLLERFKTYSVEFGDVSKINIAESKATETPVKKIERIEDVSNVDHFFEAAKSGNYNIQLPDAIKLIKNNPRFAKIVKDAKVEKYKSVSEFLFPTIKTAIEKMNLAEFLVYSTLTDEKIKTQAINYYSPLTKSFFLSKPPQFQEFNFRRYTSRVPPSKGGKKTRKLRKKNKSSKSKK